MSIQIKLKNLTTEQLIDLHGVLVNAALAYDCKGNHKRIFEQKRSESKGWLRIIYNALKKATKPQINAISHGLVELLPKGVIKE